MVKAKRAKVLQPAEHSYSAIRASLQAEARELASRLSVRELETLTGLALGQSSIEIAAHLGLASRTVLVYVDRIYRRTGLKKRACLIRLAYRSGIASLWAGGPLVREATKQPLGPARPR